MSSASGPRAPNMIEQLEYHHDLQAITNGLARARLEDAGPPLPDPRRDHVAQNTSMGTMPPRYQQPSSNVVTGTGAVGATECDRWSASRYGATSLGLSAPVVDDRSVVNPAAQPTTSLPEVPANFLTAEFMESVARTLDDFDTRALFRPEDIGVGFEEFRDWFDLDDPDDPDMKYLGEGEKGSRDGRWNPIEM